MEKLVEESLCSGWERESSWGNTFIYPPGRRYYPVAFQMSCLTLSSPVFWMLVTFQNQSGASDSSKNVESQAWMLFSLPLLLSSLAIHLSFSKPPPPGYEWFYDPSSNIRSWCRYISFLRLPFSFSASFTWFFFDHQFLITSFSLLLTPSTSSSERIIPRLFDIVRRWVSSNHPPPHLFFLAGIFCYALEKTGY